MEGNMTPEQQITIRHFCYFGPVPEALINQIDNDDWRHALKQAATIADLTVEAQPELRFNHWGNDLDREVQSMISGLTNLNPGARITTAQLMTHEWWQAEDTLNAF